MVNNRFIVVRGFAIWTLPEAGKFEFVCGGVPFCDFRLLVAASGANARLLAAFSDFLFTLDEGMPDLATNLTCSAVFFHGCRLL